MLLIVGAIMSANIVLTLFVSARVVAQESAARLAAQASIFTFSCLKMCFPKVNDTLDQNKKPATNDLSLNIAPHGDLILKLPARDGMLRFRVASQVLCISSPVFFAMLNPTSRFKEATEFHAHPRAAPEPYVLSIKDDNPTALMAILSAIHLRNSLVPSTVNDWEILWHIAVICDKYDFTAALSVWIRLWAKGWNRRKVPDSGYGYWLFIAWTFGLENIFTTVSKGIILRGHYAAAAGVEGPFLSSRGRELDDLSIPDCVIG